MLSSILLFNLCLSFVDYSVLDGLDNQNSNLCEGFSPWILSVHDTLAK